MHFQSAVRHILQVCNLSKAYVHWQVSSRIVLMSLALEGRISNQVREQISNEIANGTLLNWDHLLEKEESELEEG
jgi:hypothetical protein